MKEELVYIGVDIAKPYLDAAIGNEKHRFCNDTVGHRQLVRWIEQTEAPVQVICESSGGYERRLVQALARARVSDTSVVRLNRSLINQIKKQIEKLDLLIKEHIEQSPRLFAKAEKLTAIKGVGERTAALLLAQMPELGQLNRREVAALVGVAPV